MAGNAGRDGAVGHKDVAGCVFGGVGAARGPEPVSTGSEFCGVGAGDVAPPGSLGGNVGEGAGVGIRIG